MVTTPLDLKYVYKRGRSLERRKSVTESARIPDIERDMNEDYRRRTVESFIRECTSYEDAISLLETLYVGNRFDLLESATQKVINDVIPTVSSLELPKCISYISTANIGNVNRDRLTETAKLYKSVDRIIKNHRNLSKRFEMNLAGKSDKEKCYKICEMVCTYSLSKYIKFNIALEELAYIGYMNNNRMPDRVMVENVSNYFLILDDNSEEDIRFYGDAIKSSKIISEGADMNVKYLTSSHNNSKSIYWKDRLNEWKMNPDKSIDTLVELARDNFSNINTLNTILEYVNDFTKINDIEFDPMTIFTEADIDNISGDSAHNIMSVIKESGDQNTDDVVSTMRYIWEADINDKVYSDDTKTPETFTSDEIDKFALHNMISDAQSVGEFLDRLEKTSMKENPVKITRVVTADDTHIDESSIINHVDADGYISMKLRGYVFEGVVDDVHDLLESSINCINNILYNSNSSAYYSISENYFDISIRSKYKIILSEAQEIARGFADSDKQTICEIRSYSEMMDSIMESPIGIITDTLTNESYAATVTPQEISLVHEAMNPILMKDTWEEFLELCKVEANPKYEAIKRIVTTNLDESESFDLNTDYDSLIEFVLDVMSLNEGVGSNIKKAVGDITKPFNKKQQNVVNTKAETPNDQQQNNAEDSKDNKPAPSNNSGSDEPKRAINSINDAKLAWQGVKSKMKGASAKEQEMSRDLDIEFNHLLRTMKATYGTDHREEIITGEVNHSISKIIKIGIALAGIGIAAHSVIIPVIGAVALFARSKYTTLKEKKLILDEIDIELQVLDREIQRAEQSGSTKKYRQLLTIQKNIQRRRQEIYYDIARKGSKVPMQSTKGLRARE